MKYIVTHCEQHGEEIFVFPESINHNIMAEAIGRLKNQSFGDWSRITRTPVSAGFVKEGKCVGRSESLNLLSRPQDSDLLPTVHKNPQKNVKVDITSGVVYRDPIGYMSDNVASDPSQYDQT